MITKLPSSKNIYETYNMQDWYKSNRCFHCEIRYNDVFKCTFFLNKPQNKQSEQFIGLIQFDFDTL